MILFITRELRPNSPLQRVTEKGHTLLGQSGIAFTPLPFTDFPDTDWLFFYSQQGIRFFFEGLSEEAKKSTYSKKMGVMGKASSALLQELTHKSPDYVSGMDLEKEQSQFKKITQNQSVLFVEASHSNKRFQDPGNKRHFALKVYDNVVLSGLQLPEADVYIFTSPLNVQAFLHTQLPQPGTHLVAIGEPTAKTLFAYTQRNDIIIANRSDEEGILSSLAAIISL
ncbi:MAG TPA: uroporphyrinogen-III synthase [Saprospiraceae bacterium]|nr:uroporphyrinogen-III synthase [Saprospiraceae bacterium]